MGDQEQGKNSQEVKEILQNDSTLSIRATSKRLQLPPTMVHHILCKCLSLFPCKLPNMNGLNEADKWS